MGELADRVKLSLLVNGNGEVDNFKKNSLFFFNKYLKSDEDVKNLQLRNIRPGGFYFFHYKDDSNWMKWSPVYLIDFKKYNDQIIFLCVNFNFLPLEVRVNIFDKFIQLNDFEKDGKPIKDYDKNLVRKIKYQRLYQELKRINYAWCLQEFNAAQLVMVHKISMLMLPRFLYHQHPKVKYDPKKLNQIWKAKLADQVERDKDMTQVNLEDFYNIDKDISEKYTQLQDHIKRVRTSYQKYGRS